MGLEATRAIRSDEAISRTNARKVPLVRSNEVITVYSRRPGITVKRFMKSRGTGAVGDSITAVSLDRGGRDKLLVRVTGVREAEILNTGGQSPTAKPLRTGTVPYRELPRLKPGNSSGYRTAASTRLPSRNRTGRYSRR